MSNLRSLGLEALRSTWLRVLIFLAVVLALTIAAGAPVCIGCR